MSTKYDFVKFEAQKKLQEIKNHCTNAATTIQGLQFIQLWIFHIRRQKLRKREAEDTSLSDKAEITKVFNEARFVEVSIAKESIVSVEKSVENSKDNYKPM